MLAIFGVLLIAGAIFYVVYTTQITAQATSAEERLNIEWGSEQEVFRAPFYIQLAKPLLSPGLVKALSGFWKPEQLEGYRKTLVTAGLLKKIQPEHIVVSKIVVFLYATAFCTFLAVAAEEPPSPLLLFGLPILAFFMPNIDISSRAKSRQFELKIAMPYVVDLLALSTEAGLDFMGAISKVVERAPRSPIIEELEIVLKDIQLGKTRSDALRDLAGRMQMMELTSFVAVLVSSDQMGASIGAALRAQSESMRQERLVRAEKLGAQASQKILIPLVFFILPAVMLVIFGPIILQFMGRGGAS